MGEGGAGVASANDSNPAAMVLVLLDGLTGHFVSRTEKEADTGEANEAENEIHDNDTPRWSKAGSGKNPNHTSRGSTQKQGMEDAREIGCAEIAEQGCELVKGSQEEELQGHEPEENKETLLLLAGFHFEVKAQFVGEPEAGAEHGAVHQEAQPNAELEGVAEEVEFHKSKAEG